MDQKRELKVYTGIAARILKLLGSGSCTQVQAAQHCGVDESYVSQLCAEIDFQEQIQDMITASTERANAIDNNYETIENVLSKRLSDQASLMFNPDQILRTLKFANEAKRKIQPIHKNSENGNNPNQQTSVLVLPTVIKQTFIVSPNNEVVSVDNKELVTLNSESMKELVNTRKSQPKQLESKTQDTSLEVIKNVPKQVSAEWLRDL